MKKKLLLFALMTITLLALSVHAPELPPPSVDGNCLTSLAIALSELGNPTISGEFDEVFWTYMPGGFDSDDTSFPCLWQYNHIIIGMVNNAS